jgi:hypothetical protein
MLSFCAGESSHFGMFPDVVLPVVCELGFLSANTPTKIMLAKAIKP